MHRICQLHIGSIALSLVVFSADVSGRVLSDEDPRYKELERIQSERCEDATHLTHPCELAAGECKSIVNTLSSALYPDDEFSGIISDACSERATRYELPIAHWLLKQRVNVVTKIAADMGVLAETEPIYGSLSIPSVNAYYIAPSGTPIMLFNTQFFEFANELTKIMGLTIPVYVEGENYVILPEKADSLAKMRSSPEIRDHIISLIDYFLGGKKTSYLPPNQFTATAQIVYNEGIEVFAVAHEYGHVYFLHGKDNDNHPRQLEEIEADIYGLRIMIELQRRKARDANENPFFGALLHAVEFYFIARHILDDAKQANIDHDVEENFEDVDIVAACVITPSCRISDFGGRLKSLQQSDEHPPHLFSREDCALDYPRAGTGRREQH